MQGWFITFPSVYHAFRAERLLRRHNFNVKLVPVPRSLSGSCEGMAAQLNKEQIPGAVNLLDQNNITMLYKGIEAVVEP